MMVRFAVLLMVMLLAAIPAAASTLRVTVAEFKVSGASGRDDLKGALQSMLASRLAGEDIQVVGANESPDATVIGTYIVFGKVFSLDGQVVGRDGKIIARAFEQGDAADEVIPAVGRFAHKLGVELAKTATPPAGGTKAAVPAVSQGAVPAVVVKPAATADVVRPAPAEVPEKGGDIVRPEKVDWAGSSGMIGQRLEGVMIGLTQLKRTDRESRDLVVALERELRLYRLDRELKLLGVEKGFGGNEKIISVDSADLDQDGAEEIYVTAFRGDQLASRVYLLENGTFRKLAADLPFFFRSMALKGEARKVYAQEMSTSEDFYGDLREVVKKGATFATGIPIKLPRFGNIYNVNLLTDKNGATLFVTIHPDGYLCVYDDRGENIWKSNDKFGGSETYFSRDDSQNMSFTGIRERKRFIEQRVTVSKTGEIVVPKNEGNFVIGDSRSFNKNAVYAFAWNGAALEELWHTKPSQNYLSDYSYDGEKKELVILEVVKKAGVVEQGASAIVIKRIE